MKERSIIFKAEEVRAILAGRKAQARRIVKLPYGADVIVQNGKVWKPARVDYEGYVDCPFGQPGDRLWVRESWAVPHTCDHLPPRLVPETARIHYLATAPLGGLIKRPSIHMPRWASRILLEVTGVRVERLQDISEADAQAEGATGQCPVGNLRIYNEAPLAYHFAQIWEQAHPNTWDQNPWVWVIEFRRVEP